MAAGSWDCWVPTTAIHMKSCDTSSRLAESESVVNSTAIMQPFTIYA